MAIKLHESLPLTPSDHERQNDLLKRHHVWLQALEAFESPQTMSAKDILSLTALKLGYCTSYSACACIMDKIQLMYDAHLDSYRSLVRHVSILIDSLYLLTSDERSAALTAAANFTFDTSVIPAPFYTAIRCRCPATRRGAIALLAKNLPREGLWDPEQYCIVAERVVAIEEMEVDAQERQQRGRDCAEAVLGPR